MNLNGMNSNITDKELNELFLHAVFVRRELHACPELGFDLEETVAIVKAELDHYGIAYTEKYGKGSVVAEIGSGEKLLALRADMDALPVEEKTGLPYASKISGRMHACGHDSHMAILLAVARYLKSVESSLPCKVRLIFQPSEECAESGAKLLVENGVMDGVDHIICTHCENGLECGNIGVCAGDYMAACVPLSIKFFGKSAHATLPAEGVDAIAMATNAYNKMKEAVESIAEDRQYIWSVGKLSGGTAHNVISDYCEMEISFRFYDMMFAEQVKCAVYKICETLAQDFGGRVEINWNMSTGPVHNDREIVDRFKTAVTSCGLPIQVIEQRMSSEDFGWYQTKSRGMLFLFGTRNESTGCTTLIHCSDFKIDENGMKAAIKAFITYALQCK